MRTCAVANTMTWVALVQAQDYAHWDLGIFKSHFVRHAATCHTSDNSKIIQKSCERLVLLHTASVSSFLTLTSLTAVFVCSSRGDGYSMLQQCRLDAFGEWSKLQIDFSLASVVPPSFAMLRGMSVGHETVMVCHGLPVAKASGRAHAQLDHVVAWILTMGMQV